MAEKRRRGITPVILVAMAVLVMDLLIFLASVWLSCHVVGC